jgi:Sulfatase
VLAQGTRTLDAAGFHSRSGYLRSPTFGGISWLAHSTLQSGLWVDNQQRYDVLLTSRRQTLSRAFGRAGWRTVSDIPADTKDWPPGAFYHYEKLYDSRNVGYQGPRFGYPTMPDQYTLDAFHRLELAPHPRRPVMAEIDLITSHTPWSRTPHLVPQQSVGDGSVFDGMPQQAPSKTQIWSSAHSVQAAYAGSIRYSLRSLVEFLKSYGDSNTVVVFMGDHQPATIVSGAGASHDVPVAVVAHDPAVLDRMASWRWRPGLDPGATAPVMRMDRFRDRFLETFRS